MRTLQRFLFEHRRPLAAGLAVLAVISAVGAVRPAPEGTPAVVAARDLPSGTVVTAHDVRRVRLPADALPRRAFGTRPDVVGRRVAGPMRAGEPFTDRRVLDADLLEGYGRGTVLSTVRLADGDALVGVRVGDVVDVVAVDPTGETPPAVAARAVTVALLPPADDDGSRVIGVVTTEDVALELAETALESRLSIMTSAS